MGEPVNKRSFVQGLLAVSFGSWLTAPQAQVVIRVAPPPPREEPMPPPRRGYVWAPGHWEWRNGRHAWVRGNWIRARRGQHWQPDRWVERNGRYQLERGRWARGDRDGDGVPNRVDARPNNPNRN
jgi:hypothetical protein